MFQTKSFHLFIQEAFNCDDDVFLIVEKQPSYPEDELSEALMLMMDHHHHHLSIFLGLRLDSLCYSLKKLDLDKQHTI